MAELGNSFVAGLSDTDLIARLRNSEDNFVERKPNGDKAGWLQTAVAFANSTPIGYPAILFVGVDNKGTPQQNGDLEALQKTVAKEINRAFPPIYYQPKAIELDKRPFLAVIVPGSPARPHFAGKSYIRVGPETRDASESQVESLVAERLGKVYEIRKYLDKRIQLSVRTTHTGGHIRSVTGYAKVIACNAFYVTLDVEKQPQTGFGMERPGKNSYPLEDLKLSYDHGSETLLIEIRRY
jgi:hypothetical protein